MWYKHRHYLFCFRAKWSFTTTCTVYDIKMCLIDINQLISHVSIVLGPGAKRERERERMKFVRLNYSLTSHCFPSHPPPRLPPLKNFDARTTETVHGGEIPISTRMNVSSKKKLQINLTLLRSLLVCSDALVT